MCSPCFNVLKGFCCSKPPPPATAAAIVPKETLFHPTQPLYGAIVLLGIACGIVATPLKLWLRSACIGDLANAFVLVNTGGFLAVVLANNAGLIDWLSPSFSREGFCVFGHDLQLLDLPLLQSHILCFYVDTLTALILALLARKHQGMQGLAKVANAPAGVFMHGLAHLFLWADGLDGSSPDVPAGYLREVSPASRLRSWAWLFVFFFLLLRSVPSVGNRHAAVWSVLHGAVLSLFVPGKLGFTYVQTALLWVGAAYEMRRPTKDKDFFYDLGALVVNVPVGLVAWAEALACDSFYKSMGGHVWYDGIIPLSMFAYFAIARAHQLTQPHAKAA